MQRLREWSYHVALNKIFVPKFFLFCSFEKVFHNTISTFGIFVTLTNASAPNDLYMWMGERYTYLLKDFTSLILLSIELCWTTSTSRYTFVGSGTFTKIAASKVSWVNRTSQKLSLLSPNLEPEKASFHKVGKWFFKAFSSQQKQWRILSSKN